MGFLRTAVHEEAGVVVHAQLDRPEGGGVMLGARREGAGCDLPPGAFNAYVVTDRVADLYRRLTEAGVDISTPYQDKDYGGAAFGIRDPEGNQWHFGSYRGEPRPAR